MLVFDRSKTQVLSANSAAPMAMLRGWNNEPDYNGLGFNMDSLQEANQFNPEPISRAAIDVIASMQKFLGAGRGRMEADQITPIQNYIHYNVLKPIAEAVNASYAQALSGSQLQDMLDALLETKKNWLDFLHNTSWTDGRAATQAENDLAFLFDDQERKLRALMVDAPWFSNVEPPSYTTYTPGGGATGGRPSTTVTRSGASGASSFLRGTSDYLPLILGAAFLFMLPRIGKGNG